MMWDKLFEELLRGYLPFLSDEEALTPKTALRDLGLDSLAMVELLARLEQAYETRFVDDALTLATFETAGSLWSTLQRMAGVAA